MNTSTIPRAQLKNELGLPKDEVEICVSGIFDRLSHVEKHHRRLPFLLVGAIAIGCTVCATI